MVDRRVLWEESVGTSGILTRLIAYGVVLEFLVKEDLIGGVLVSEIWGQVGHQIPVVHHAVVVGHLQVDELGEVFVANTRATKLVNLDGWFQVKHCQTKTMNGCDGGSHTVTSHNNSVHIVSF